MIATALLFAVLSAPISRADTTTTAPASPPPQTLPSVPSSNAPFLESYPQLKDYLYEEPQSGFWLGHGGSPVGLIRSTYMFTADLFELHWIKDRYDIELFNFSFAIGRGSTAEFSSQRFTFRAAPKYRIFGPVSVGPLVGYELVNFPNVGARIFNGGYIEPNSEPFSARGWIYGLMASETFPYSDNKYRFQINEMIYQENYSTTTTADGWTYIYNDQSVQTNQSQIAAGTIFLVEASFLY